MYSKKALIFTANSLSLAAFPKVRSSLLRLYSLHNLLHSIKTAHSISTAVERSVFQTESHEFNRPENEHTLDYQRNPDGLHGEHQNPIEFQHNPSGTSSYWGENPRAAQMTGRPQNGFRGENSGYFQQNPSDGYRGNIGEFQQNLVGQNKNFNAVHQEDTKGLQRYPIGFQQEIVKVSQQNPVGYHSENVHSQISHGVCGEDPRIVQQGQNSMEFQRTQNSPYAGNATEVPKNANGYQSQQNLNGYQFQQNVNGYQFQQNANEYRFQQNAGGYHPENNGGFQQNATWSPRGVAHSSDVKLGGEPAETSETNQFKGTVEELDSFCKEGKVKEAVEVLGLLEKHGIKLGIQRYIQLMKACGEASSLQEAKAVHDHLIRSLGNVKVNVYNQILEMYCKCGSMSDAYEVLGKMPERNLTTWDTMITGLAKNGLGEDAIDLFTQFKEAGLRPDGQMFFAVFSACSVLGDIDEGIAHFESMSKVYGIAPSMEHYVSVVDMLGSTGYLDETMEFIEKMPFEPSVEVWETMMNLCRVHGNTELGDHCAELVDHFDPSRLTDQSKSGLVPVKPSDIAKEKEKKKLSGQNLLEVRSRVHEYRAGDTSHPEKDRIYALLRGMASQMKESGYVPETRFVLHDIDQEGKEEALLAHSERLAVSYGLISSPARSPIRIIKNLRVCGDCHNALKIISKLVGRELIIRDAKRFHHFKDGLCSCRDYW